MDVDGAVFLWIIIVTFYYVALAHLLFHWQALLTMEPADYMVRGTLFFLYLVIATSHLGVLLGFDSIWRRVAFAVFGCTLAIGMTILLWKYRDNRKAAVYLTAVHK